MKPASSETELESLRHGRALLDARLAAAERRRHLRLFELYMRAARTSTSILRFESYQAAWSSL
jgi:hypothetical protein